MSGEKTEQPTGKKLREAREKGDVAHSKDFTQTLLVLALFGYMLGNAHGIVESLGRLVLLPSTLVGMPFERALPVALDAAPGGRDRGPLRAHLHGSAAVDRHDRLQDAARFHLLPAEDRVRALARRLCESLHHAQPADA